ncbi:MAG: manganese-binding transcriptional regulator MntR [Rhodospirillales bacterium]|nr:manganese-binding transcriptional regulator MntR [Rhodospirillales bacterium]
MEKPATDHPSAERFEKVRQEHRNETAEDYVELIAELIDRRGEARAVDLSARLGVSQPTVNKVITRLRRDGLVEGRRYRSLFLTDEGRHLAEAMRRRHRIVLDFLLSLGISEEVAHADAEGIEHHVSDETLEAFRRGTRRTAGRDAGQASS